MSVQKIRIATRPSKLALAQTGYVADLLKEAAPEVQIELVPVSTEGDRDKSDFLYKSALTVGFFTSEVENALLTGWADLAVHSMKDLPTSGPQRLVIAAVPPRQSVEDALIYREKLDSIDQLPVGTTVGTSSLRRIAQMKHYRDDLDCTALRGNVETRVNKVRTGQVAAAVVACAGLNRLGMEGDISLVLPLDRFIPAPAQGALAVQIRRDDAELALLLGRLDHQPSRITAMTERRVLAVMQGGCSIPLGVNAVIDDGRITLRAVIADTQGKKFVSLCRSGPVDCGDEIADALAEELLDRGGREILKQLRNDMK